MPTNMKSSNLSILVIEDNEGDFVLVEDFLIETYNEIHIQHCVDFNTAEECFKQNEDQYAAILFDFNFPDSNGIELISEVLQICKDTPVIVLTGYADINLASHWKRC